MSKVLIIHHLEMTWETGYNNHETSFYELASKIKTHIKKSNYDKIVLTQFENYKPQHEHYQSGIADLVTNWFDYGYGWDKEGCEVEEKIGCNGEVFQDNYGNEYVKGGDHSEIVLITDWMKELGRYKDNVSICGAFDGECIEDLEIALTACDVKFRRLEKLIV